MDKIYKQLQDKQATIEEIINTQEVLLQLLDKYKTGAKNKIAYSRREIDIRLANIERQSLNAVDKDFRIMKTTLDAMKEAAADLKKSEGNIAQQFVCMKMAQLD